MAGPSFHWQPPTDGHPYARDPALYNSLFNDALYSDFTIKIGSEAFKCHKVILHRGSEWFAKLTDGSFAEARKGEVELLDEDPDAAKAMLHWLYGHEYYNAYLPHWQLLNSHAHVYITADKYNLKALKASVVERMDALFSRTKKLEVEDITNAIDTIWSSTLPGEDKARMVVASYCLKHVEDFSKEAVFTKALRETELGTDMVLAMARKEREAKNEFGTCDCCGVRMVSKYERSCQCNPMEDVD